MPHQTLSIDELAGYLHIARRDVERLVQEGAIPGVKRGGRMVFRRGEIDEWASQRILGLPGRSLDWYHSRTMQGTRPVFPQDVIVPTMLSPDRIQLGLTAKTRSSVIRAVVALAETTGHVLDTRELLASIEAREALGSTALPGGLALLHARQQRENRFDGSFLVLGRTIQAIPFGAPDGWPTRLFFLVCCEDDRIHLHTLARLCLIALKTDIVNQLLAATEPAAAFDALVAAEQSVLPVGKAADDAVARRRNR